MYAVCMQLMNKRIYYSCCQWFINNRKGSALKFIEQQIEA